MHGERVGGDFGGLKLPCLVVAKKADVPWAPAYTKRVLESLFATKDSVPSVFNAINARAASAKALPPFAKVPVLFLDLV